MIDILMIVIAVMASTLLYDKTRKRPKFILKEGFDTTYNVNSRESRLFTPSYFGFLNNYSNFKETGYNPGTPKQGSFNPYSLNSNMESYQPIDYDNNIASIYGYKQDGYDTTPKNFIRTCSENDGFMGMNRWCGCESLNSNGTAETATRQLMGGVNPKSLIPPKMVPPITDMEEWGTDNYTIHSAINSHHSDDLFLSGYVTLNDCMCKGVCRCERIWKKPFIKENFDQPIDHTDHNYISPYDVSEQRFSRPQILQNYGISKIPDEKFSTSITDGNELLYVEKRLKNKKSHSLDYITGDEPSMIYDPRMVGYSDSKRSYVDKLLGQPKFYYDDINAARAPNYITRNKIDIYSFGESTGRLRDPKDGSSCGNNNQLAVEEFHNSALQHRADMMQSLMNKRNGEMWQLRQFPISTNGQRMLGGTSKI
jgi:hypothetical protein